MITDFHTHTKLSDGKNTPEEMVISAIEKGMDMLGFSEHSYTFFDEEVSIEKDSENEYIKHIRSLSEKYKDKITVLCGIEQDYYSGLPKHDFDYVIGSVHYIEKDGKYISIDQIPDILKELVDEYYCGDAYAMCEEYFDLVSKLPQTVAPDVIGHFNLICKFNEKHPLFSENHPRYVAAWKKAVDKLIPYNIPFEINTGAIARGYKTVPYPSLDMISYIKDKGGKFIFNSDSHAISTLGFNFAEAAELVKDLNLNVIDKIK